MNSKHKKPNPANAFLIILLAVVLIFIVAHFAFGNKNNNKETETPVQTGGTIGACTREYDPVCGDNGVEYMNPCLAGLAKVSYKEGKCESTSTQSGAENISKIPTHDDQIMCPAVYNPVCGKDGNTYSNDCQAGVAKVDIAHEGACVAKTTNETKPTTPTTETTTPTITPTTPKTENTNTGVTLPSDHETTVISKLDNYDVNKYHHYKNESIGYSFAIPKNTAYQGFGAQNGANHTLAINTNNEGVTDFASADVKVYYYAKTPTNPPANSTAVTLNNGATVYVEGTNTENVQNIVQTITESVEKN